MDVACEAVDQVVADEQVEPAVAVVVDERRRHAPAAAIVRAGLLRDVGERAVAVVAEQLAAAEAREVEVDAAVVVEVAGRDAHAVRVGMSMPLCSVTSVKCSVRVPSAFTIEIVAEQPILRAAPFGGNVRLAAAASSPSIWPCTR